MLKLNCYKNSLTYYKFDFGWGCTAANPAAMEKLTTLIGVPVRYIANW